MVIRILVIAIAAAVVTAGCGSESDSGSGAESAQSSLGDSATARCETLLPARTVAETTGQPLILRAAEFEPNADRRFDLLCGYVEPSVTQQQFEDGEEGTVAAYVFTGELDPASVNEYDAVLEVGGLPAGLTEPGSNSAYLFVVGPGAGIQVEVNGVVGAREMVERLGEVAAPSL